MKRAIVCLASPMLWDGDRKEDQEILSQYGFERP